MDVTKLIADDHALRKEQVAHLKAQAKQYAEGSEQRKAEAQAKRIRNCDGSSTQRLREWFRDIELTIPYASRTVYIASLTAEGALRLELEKFLAGQNDRAAVEWNAVQKHLQKTFLSLHEDEKLRDELEQIKRNPYETTATYGRRFSETADLAYPSSQRNQDQQRTMLRTYMKGLKDEKLVLRLVQERGPKDYLEAIESVAQYESDSYSVYRALNGEAPPPERQEEPMDISAVKEQGATGGESRLDSIERKINGLTREFTKLMAAERGPRGAPEPGRRERGQWNQGASRPPPPRRRPLLKFTEDGRPICARCDRAGHMKAECPQRPGPPARRQGPPHGRKGGY